MSDALYNKGGFQVHGTCMYVYIYTHKYTYTKTHEFMLISDALWSKDGKAARAMCMLHVSMYIHTHKYTYTKTYEFMLISDALWSKDGSAARAMCMVCSARSARMRASTPLARA
jgi:hypothetical protein